MKIARLSIVLPILLVLSHVVLAQQSAPDWLHDLDQVEVISTTYYEEPLPSPAPQTEIVVDNSARAIVFPDGHSISYPDEVENISLNLYSEHPLIYQNRLYMNVSVANNTDSQIWYLDLTRSEYTLYGQSTLTTECGDLEFYQFNAWVLLREDARTYLCRLEDGFRFLIPDDLNVDQYLPYVSVAPDGSHLAFILYLQSGDARLYGYDVADARLLDIGWIDTANVQPLGWYGNDVVVFGGYSAGANTIYDAQAYVVDINQGYLLAHIGPLRFNDSAYFNAQAGTVSGDYEATYHCWREIYSIPTRSLEIVDYQRFCDYAEYHRQEDPDTGYYRVSTGENETAIVRFNPITREQVELYRGAVEGVSYVSENEQYAVLMLSIDGVLRVPPGTSARSEDAHAILALIDLSSGNILYQTRTGWYGWSGFWQNTMLPVAPDYWFVRRYYSQVGADHTLVHLAEGVVDERQVDVVLKPFGGHWLLDDDDASYEFADMTAPIDMQLYNLNDGTFVPILSLPDHSLSPSIEYLSDVTFRVHFESDTIDTHRWAEFEIRIQS
jgi:hypothetical protein